MTHIPKEIIGRYAYKNSISYLSALKTFSELEIFLQSASTSNLTPNSKIDKAWHEFILHTKLYEDYCKSNFGKFIHHIPTSPILNEDGKTLSLELVNDCSSCQSAPPGPTCRSSS